MTTTWCFEQIINCAFAACGRDEVDDDTTIITLTYDEVRSIAQRCNMNGIPMDAA